MQRIPKLRGLLFIALVNLVISYAPAQAEILIGQTTSLTGPPAAGVKETLTGAKIYLDWVNAQGGVNGHNIKLVTIDDQYEVKNAVANAEKLASDDKVLALFLTRGTAINEALLPVVEKFQIPLIAPSTGAKSMHQPIKKWVFNIRSPYQLEAQRAVVMLNQMGNGKIGVIYQDDSFGVDALTGADLGFKEIDKTPAFIEKVTAKNPDYTAFTNKLRSSGAQAVMVLCVGSIAAKAIVQANEAGAISQFATLSNNASEGFIQDLGRYSKGVIVTQGFPYERSNHFALVKEATKLLHAATPDEALTPAKLEGFAAAKVLVGALKIAGKTPSRANIQAALESMKKFDLGGIDVGFSPTDHTGLRFVEFSIISSGRGFIR